MSMLTAQADELRHGLYCNDELDDFDIVKHYAHEIRSANRLMREAADTILDMRERLQDVQTAKERVYNAGFDNGMKATLQQLSGLIAQGAYVDEIKEWAYRQWEEEVV